MADDLTTQTATLATIPGSSIIATDEAAGGRHVQLVKLADPTNGSATPLGTATGIPVVVRTDLLRVQVTPTISTSIYAAKDAIGGLMTFANAASSSGGSGVIRSVTIEDNDQERADIDVVFFRATVAGTVTDNAPFDPTDGDLANFVGFVPFGSGFYSDFNDNCAAFVATDLPYSLSGTDLFGVLVARSTPTYTATTDIVVTVHVERF